MTLSSTRKGASAYLVLILLSSGCGAAAIKPHSAPAVGINLVRSGDGGGPDLAVITRPSGGIVQLSLFIDAGARDADPPEVATLAAWLVAEEAGAGVEGWASPDGVEMTLTCANNGLANCLSRLARGVALREARPARLAGARQRLIQARRQNEASDPGRGADRLALQALFGPAVRGLLPIGNGDDDAELTAERVQAFLAQHFGLGRLLLIAAGELDAEALTHAASAAFGRTPRALAPRAVRDRGPKDTGGVEVGVDNKAALSMAIAAPDLAQAQGAASALEARLVRDALATKVGGHVFAVRGAALALLRVETREALACVRAAAHELERIRHEGVTPGQAPPSGEQLRVLTRRLGTRWVAGEPTGSSALALGIGILVAGGRADRLRLDNPDAPLLESAHDAAEAAWKEGIALGNPRPSGASDEQSASVALENGARIELRQHASEQVVVAVRFSPGAGSEPPTLHSRAALLATLVATTCASTLPHSRLTPLGVKLEPRVDPQSWGLLVTAPSGAWPTALSLALECALHPALDRQELADARLELRERLGPALGPGELRAAAAEALSPGAPGAIAPWGSPFHQASVSLPALRELYSQSRRGSNVVVSGVGPIPVQDAVAFIARRLSELSQKQAAQEHAPKGATAPEAVEAQKINQPTLGLALWRVAMAGADASGARAFAVSMRAELGTAGVTASWHDAGVTAEGGWAAVALGGAAEDLALVSARLHEIASAVPNASLERAADQAFELAEQARAADAGSAIVEAEALAGALLGAPAPRPNREAARTLATRLAQAEPIWLPLR